MDLLKKDSDAVTIGDLIDAGIWTPPASWHVSRNTPAKRYALAWSAFLAWRSSQISRDEERERDLEWWER